MSGVSRETSERLTAFAALVRKWSPKINLVAPSTLDDLESRHIADSEQVFHVKHSPWRTWYDFGSGGGFPGIVIAILAKEQMPGGHVTLIESDRRKSTFLRTAIRELDLAAAVVSQRIEAVDLPSADVLSARALAPLDKLFGLTQRFAHSDSVYLFQKGRTWQDEVNLACQEWSFTHDVVQSKTSQDAVILKFKEVTRA